MPVLQSLTIALFVIWCATEIAIALVSLRNQSKRSSDGADRLSFVVVWCATIPPIGLALLIREGLVFADGFGSLAALSPWLGSLGYLALALGISLRIGAVATLKGQFTTHVAILGQHSLVDKGIYRIIRHPAYLGHLASLFGMGLVTANWVSLVVLIVLPLAALVYRIQVEEQALLRHFGSAYRAYVRRTHRLIPGVW
jgi:protein-S-isoprenylcysteine O-methyltransferase Ste14